MRYDVVIFDCDGVILNSNKIKTDAFREALSAEKKELVDEFISYHKAHGGVSRYKKLRYFYEQIKKDNNEELINLALFNYAKIVKKALISCPMINGIEVYLQKLQKNNIPCFVNTGSDEKELIDVFEQRGILQFFKAILGSPSNKYDNMNKIENQISLNNALYFGDAKMDMEVANKYYCDFIFVEGVSEWKEGKEVMKNKNNIVKDFTNIENIRKIYVKI